jgi:subtilisin family serine protease
MPNLGDSLPAALAPQPRAAVRTEAARDPLGLVGLTPLMDLTSGRADIRVGLIDGPVASDHPDLAAENIRQISGGPNGADARADGAARAHGTFVAGMLSARRGTAAPALCPDCTLLVRPIFGGATTTDDRAPSATPEELGAAIVECVEAGARVLNLSLALAQPSPKREHALEEALGHAARRGAIVVAAAGNQGTIGSSALTRHPCVVPVVACDLGGRPLGASNLAGSIGRRGLRAPGEAIASLGPKGEALTLSGTSFAVPFVTGTLALLWSAFPAATAAEVRAAAVTHPLAGGRTTVVPPLLDAAAAYHTMATGRTGG